MSDTETTMTTEWAVRWPVKPEDEPAPEFGFEPTPEFEPTPDREQAEYLIKEYGPGQVVSRTVTTTPWVEVAS